MYNFKNFPLKRQKVVCCKKIDILLNVTKLAKSCILCCKFHFTTLDEPYLSHIFYHIVHHFVIVTPESS